MEELPIVCGGCGLLAGFLSGARLAASVTVGALLGGISLAWAGPPDGALAALAVLLGVVAAQLGIVFGTLAGIALALLRDARVDSTPGMAGAHGRWSPSSFPGVMAVAARMGLPGAEKRGRSAQGCVGLPGDGA